MTVPPVVSWWGAWPEFRWLAVGWECVGTWLWLLIYQEGLGDSRQATPCVLTGTWAGFLRPQGKVPGDCFPESNLRTGEEGGRMRPLPASQTPWGEVVVSLLFT